MKLLKIILFFGAAFCLIQIPVFSQKSFNTSIVPQISFKPDSNSTFGFSFSGDRLEISDSGLPYLFYRLPHDNLFDFPNVTIREWNEVGGLNSHNPSLPASYILSFTSYKIRERFENQLRIPLLKIENNRLFMASRIEVESESVPTHEHSNKPSVYLNKSSALVSMLAQGEIHRLAIVNDGVYKVDYSFMTQNGILNTPVPSSQIQLFGVQGGILPESNAAIRPLGLVEMSIEIQDGGDGLFGPGDFLLFYSDGPHTTLVNNENTLEHVHNVYTDTLYVFIKTTGSQGLRIGNADVLVSTPDYISTSSDAIWIHETERFNLTQSGREWYGEVFGVQNMYQFTPDLTNVLTGQPANLKIKLAARCVGCSSTFQIEAANQNLGQFNLQQVDACYSCMFFRTNTFSSQFTPSSSNNTIRITRLSPTSGTEDRMAWLDYIAIQFKKNNVFSGITTYFRDLQAPNNGVTEFRVSGFIQEASIWDVTDPLQPLKVSPMLVGGGYAFKKSSANEALFVAFRAASISSPIYGGKIINQNIIGKVSEETADLVIITSPELLPAAMRLSDFHLENEGLISHVFTVQQIQNEFSAGRKDISAIRDFLKFYHDVHGASTPSSVLLFGDGSYDYKHYLNRSGNYNGCLVPAFQTIESSSRSGQSHPSDYFFVNFAPNNLNGVVRPTDPIFMGIGRIPVSNINEANQVVDKIIHYTKESLCMGDWRNSVTLFADDMDALWERQFVDNNEDMFKMLDTINPTMNVDKVYTDAFIQSNNAGQRYPEANRYLNNRINRGTLFLNFIGHGGEQGLTGERVLQIDDIENWTNRNNLPFFSTATCTFTRFDNPEFVSAGERILLRPDKGGIGLMSTTRAITVVPEFQAKLFKAVFGSANGSFQNKTLGEIQMQARLCPCNSGEQNIMLFGDPAMKLAFPENLVITDSINGVYLGSGQSYPDTLMATDVVSIAGHIATRDSLLLQGFNGILFVTVFDKPSVLSTLANDPSAMKIPFTLQNSVVFKGKVSVNNGRWSLVFKVPLDINYRVDKGKISYYAQNSITDASGYFRDFNLGSSSGNCNNDITGPEVEVYMNDSIFKPMGITNPNPELFLRVFDESGINTSGAGIGHELQLTINDDIQSPIPLGEFYEADLNTYKRGSIRYPLRNLPSGFNKVEVEIWDGCNNLTRESLFFTVTGSNDALVNLYTFPNPFSNSTKVSFEHNLAHKPVKIHWDVFNVHGARIRNHTWEGTPSGFINQHWIWDGKNDFNSPVAPGLYLIRVIIITENGQTLSATVRTIYTP